MCRPGRAASDSPYSGRGSKRLTAALSASACQPPATVRDAPASPAVSPGHSGIRGYGRGTGEDLPANGRHGTANGPSPRAGRRPHTKTGATHGVRSVTYPRSPRKRTAKAAAGEPHGNGTGTTRTPGRGTGRRARGYDAGGLTRSPGERRARGGARSPRSQGPVERGVPERAHVSRTREYAGYAGGGPSAGARGPTGSRRGASGVRGAPGARNATPYARGARLSRTCRPDPRSPAPGGGRTAGPGPPAPAP